MPCEQLLARLKLLALLLFHEATGCECSTMFCSAVEQGVVMAGLLQSVLAVLKQIGRLPSHLGLAQHKTGGGRELASDEMHLLLAVPPTFLQSKRFESKQMQTHALQPLHKQLQTPQPSAP